MVTKASTLLRRARARIARDRSGFVCLALLDSAHTSQEKIVAREIVEKIDNALYPSGTVGEWLRRQGIYIGAGNMCEYRLRWMDELIRIYDEAGK